MITIKHFVFNPIQENTYVVNDETGDCLIIDAGCNDRAEENLLSGYITDQKLNPVRIVNTHCHIDHILGNAFVFRRYNLISSFHKGELEVMLAAPAFAPSFGLRYEVSPDPEEFIEEGDHIEFGNTSLRALLTPGHSPASLSFYDAASGTVFSGDALFFESIGRTDLPGGDQAVLIRGIRDELFTLDDATTVYPGHGRLTTIGHEKKFNPFLAP